MHRRAAILCLLAIAAPAPAQVVQYTDVLGDAAPRRTDLGADGLIDEDLHTVPDLLGYSIGRWAPVNPLADRYTGAWSASGGFLRFDMVFAGVVSPPGPLAIDSFFYNPYQYGPSPVFGYIEFDVDANVDTGGEVSFPQHRYAGHAARFGGQPAGPRFVDRVAQRGQHLDGNMATPPHVERSGEEFHLALFGDHINGIASQSGNDTLFGPGDTWVVTGRLLHRAHAFEPFNGANGSGSYEPNVPLRFRHDVVDNVTTVTLVYQLDQFAASQVESNSTPGTVQPMDGSHFNHTSIQEGLHSLIAGLQAIPPLDPRRSLPEFALIAGWEDQNAAGYLNPHLWKVNIVVGMAFAFEYDAAMLFTPTDVAPSPRFGDFDGDVIVGPDDFALFDAFIVEFDGDTSVDSSFIPDGAVAISGFGPGFCMFDLNYDGTVDALDRALIPFMGDLDFDSDVDGVDLTMLIDALIGGTPFNPATSDMFFNRADFSGDGVVNGADIQGFVDRFLAG